LLFPPTNHYGFSVLRPLSAASVDIRAAAKLAASREKPTDLDQLLQSVGMHLTWMERLKLLQCLPVYMYAMV
jgi:hypothetical protein